MGPREEGGGFFLSYGRRGESEVAPVNGGFFRSWAAGEEDTYSHRKAAALSEEECIM